MIGRDYCYYLKDGLKYKIINVGHIPELEFPEDLIYPNNPVNYSNLKIQIIDLFKAHLCNLNSINETLNCFKRTGFENDACFLQHDLNGEIFKYNIMYISTLYEDTMECKITISQISRDNSNYPFCNC